MIKYTPLTKVCEPISQRLRIYIHLMIQPTHYKDIFVDLRCMQTSINLVSLVDLYIYIWVLVISAINNVYLFQVMYGFSWL